MNTPLVMRLSNPFRPKLSCFSDTWLASKNVNTLQSYFEGVIWDVTQSLSDAWRPKSNVFPKHCKQNERWRDTVTFMTSLVDAWLRGTRCVVVTQLSFLFQRSLSRTSSLNFDYWENSSRPFKLRNVLNTEDLTAASVNRNRANLPIIVITQAAIRVYWSVCAGACLALPWPNDLWENLQIQILVTEPAQSCLRTGFLVGYRAKNKFGDRTEPNEVWNSLPYGRIQRRSQGFSLGNKEGAGEDRKSPENEVGKNHDRGLKLRERIKIPPFTERLAKHIAWNHKETNIHT